jgi:hypothetical protein
MVQTVQPAQPAQPVQQAQPEQQGHKDRLVLRVPMEPMASELTRVALRAKCWRKQATLITTPNGLTKQEVVVPLEAPTPRFNSMTEGHLVVTAV